MILLEDNYLSNRTFQESFSIVETRIPHGLLGCCVVDDHFVQQTITQVFDLLTDSKLVEETYKKVYEGFIEEIVRSFLQFFMVELCSK